MIGAERFAPMTTRQTVSGVERMSPTGPHSHVQNTAATMSAIGVTPVLELYSQGSIRLLLSSSRIMKRPIASNGIVQLGETASESVIGSAAPIQGPM